MAKLSEPDLALKAVGFEEGFRVACFLFFKGKRVPTQREVDAISPYTGEPAAAKEPAK